MKKFLRVSLGILWLQLASEWGLLDMGTVTNNDGAEPRKLRGKVFFRVKLQKEGENYGRRPENYEKQTKNAMIDS